MKNVFLKYKVNQIQKQSVKRKNVAFSENTYVGLLFYSLDHYKQSQSWIKVLKEKGVKVRPLIQIQKKIENAPSTPFFLEKEINFFGKINSEELLKFCNEKFDFLFYFGDQFNPIVEYILTKNPAGCRVGFHYSDQESLFDMMFSKNAGQSLNDNIVRIIKQIEDIRV